jgi:hypothetical protein
MAGGGLALFDGGVCQTKRFFASFFVAIVKK